MSRSVYTRTNSGKTKRRRGNGPRFIQLFAWIMETAAWRSLSPWAVVAYLELHRHYDGTNNGSLHLSARELEERKRGVCSRQTAARAITELREKGFIEAVRASGFNVKDRKRQAAEYRLTHLFCNVTQQPASKAFAKWRPSEVPSKNISRPHHVATSASWVGPKGVTH